LLVTLIEVVHEVTTSPNGLIFVCCKTTDPDQKKEYVFSYVIYSRKGSKQDNRSQLRHFLHCFIGLLGFKFG